MYKNPGKFHVIEVIFNQTRKFQTERRRRKVACVSTPAKVQKKVLIANIPDNKMEKGACARTLNKVQKMFQTQERRRQGLYQ